MPPERGWRLRVEDIMESTTKIQTYTEGMDFVAVKGEQVMGSGL